MITITGLARASQRLALLYWLALFALVAWNITVNIRAGVFGGDFHGTIWQAGRDVLHGHSPYPAADSTELARAGNPAVYPAPTLVLLAPFGLLPFTISAILWDLVSVGALFGALRLVGVRDLRVYVAVALSFPVADSLVLGQFDCLLALGCAVVWRLRRRAGIALALSLAALVVAKVLLWPMLIWAFAIGRRRSAVVAAGVAALAALGGWAVVGFSELKAYPHLLSALTDAFGAQGYSLTALASRLGVDANVARVVPIVALVGFCGLCVRFARRGHEDQAFVAAVAAALVGSPILWMHYTVILLIAMAIRRPTFGVAWLVPIALWLAPTENPHTALDFSIGFGLLLGVVATALAPVGRDRVQPARAAAADIGHTRLTGSPAQT
jgi:alpha-1,2-mannosyltransferase